MSPGTRTALRWWIAIGCVIWIPAGMFLLLSPPPPIPAEQAKAAKAAASAAEFDEDVRLYRESVAELEATAHAQYMSVAELAASLGTDRDHLIGFTYGLKKKRANAEAADRAARATPAAATR